jgi:hypothetical protein
MNRSFLQRFFSIIVLIAISTSCSSNLDFNQKNGELSPFFEVKDIINEEVFNVATLPLIPVVSFPVTYPLEQTIPFNINDKLTDNGIVQNIKKVVFYMTLTNGINQKLTIHYKFRDASLNSIKKDSITLVANGNSGVIEITFSETDIPNLKSVTNIQISGSMTISGATPPSGTLIVNSDAWIYLKL